MARSDSEWRWHWQWLHPTALPEFAALCQCLPHCCTGVHWLATVHSGTAWPFKRINKIFEGVEQLSQYAATNISGYVPTGRHLSMLAHSSMVAPDCSKGAYLLHIGTYCTVECTVANRVIREITSYLVNFIHFPGRIDIDLGNIWLINIGRIKH